MSYRLNIYKILRFILIILFFVFSFILVKNFIKKQNSGKTDVIENNSNIQPLLTKIKKDFEEKKKLETEARNEALLEVELIKIKAAEEAARKAEIERKKQLAESERKKREQQIASNQAPPAKPAVKSTEKAKEEKVKEEKSKTEKKVTPSTAVSKKYIQVATFQKEEDAKKALSKLGKNFSINQVKGTSGKTMYRIISVSTSDQKRLKELETQVKNKFGDGYLVRTVRK